MSNNNCNWRLEAISNAAKSRKRISYVLKVGENKVGKKKDCLIKIPSVLCSREHCSIVLYDNKVHIDDWSRNGTYINCSGDAGIQHFQNKSTERPLEENDIISFGFNIGTVYDVNDKNAFIYRLVKEDIEVIDLDDSDDEGPSTAPPTTTAPKTASAAATESGKIIEIDNKIIDIPSDSNSEYSGDECFRSIDDLDDQSKGTSILGSSDEFDENSSNESIESDEDDDEDYSDDESESFVVTKTILKCATPTETIALDDEDTSTSEQADDGKKDKTAPEHEEPTSTTELPQSANGAVADEPSTSESTTATAAISTTQTPKDDEVTESGKKTPENGDDKGDAEEDQPKQSDESEQEQRLARFKQRLADAEPKKQMITITKAHAIRKRRKTLTESEYNERKLEKKRDLEEQRQKRRELLANLGEKQKAEREEAARAAAADSNRVPFVPKVKNTEVSRSEQLMTDMLALKPTNT